MGTLVRRCAKVILVVGLFLVSIRYIYNPLSYIFSWNQHYLFVFSDFFGITGPENIEFFDALFSLVVSSIVTGVLYFSLRMLYRFFCTRLHRNSA